MKVKELLKILESLPDNQEVWWNDAIEGNDCPADYVYLCPYEGDEKVFIGPSPPKRFPRAGHEVPGYKVLYSNYD